MEIPDYDSFSRLSPHGVDFNSEDPYRCPVSTPTVNGRHNHVKSQPHQPPFIAFTSMNHSLQIPKNISSPKYSSKYRNSKSGRATTKPQKKNFDCYFVKQVDKTVHIDAQTRSTWLSSLCAQPVEEIFHKYKRKSERTNMTRQISRSGNSTPGEKALLSAWSSNASNRGAPSVVSRYSKSIHNTTTPRSSRTSFAEQNLRVHGHDSETERMPKNISFALRPVTPATSFDVDDTTVSSSGSPMFHKVFRNNLNQNSADSYGIVDSNVTVHAQHQSDKRFPELRPRKSTFSPTRKRVISDSRDTNSLSLTYPAKPYDLCESPMHIVSIGQGNREIPQSPKATTAQITCSYRLPKRALSMSLPELQGTG